MKNRTLTWDLTPRTDTWYEYSYKIILSSAKAAQMAEGCRDGNSTIRTAKI